MKCELCGAVAGSDGVSDAALTVTTNHAIGEIRPNVFVGVFGFWNHRQNRVVQICGACLSESLTGGVPLVVDGK